MGCGCSKKTSNKPVRQVTNRSSIVSNRTTRSGVRRRVKVRIKRDAFSV